MSPADEASREGASSVPEALRNALARLPDAVQEHPSHPPRRLADLVRILDETLPQHELAGRMRRRIADVRTVRWLLERTPPDLETLDRVLAWDPAWAEEALRRVQTELDDPEVRRAVTERLERLEAGAETARDARAEAPAREAPAEEASPPGTEAAVEPEQAEAEEAEPEAAPEEPAFVAPGYLAGPEDEAPAAASEETDEDRREEAGAGQTGAGARAPAAAEPPGRPEAAVEEIGRLLDQDPPDFDGVREMLTGPSPSPDVVAPVLDALYRSESRRIRSGLFNILKEVDPTVIVPLIGERIDHEEWYARRNMLALLQEFDERPGGFSALDAMSDPDWRVRIEALELALEDPDEREEAIASALRSSHQRTLRVALSAAEETRPKGTEDFLLQYALDEAMPEDLRASAVRALGGARRGDLLQAILELVWENRRNNVLAPSSPLVLAALEVLAVTWPEHPEARPAILTAANSNDPEIRHAVTRSG